MVAGYTKSNMPIRSPVRLAATEMTSRLVEVPMLVLMPPIRVAMPMGINMPEALLLVRIDTEIRIGRSRTTMGVLLTKALSTAPMTKVTSREKVGDIFQSLARYRPIGSSAPVLTRP